MNLLITGITGYIGASVAAALAKNHNVFGIFREPLHNTYIEAFQDQITLLPYEGDYASMLHAVKQAKADVVFHFATFYTGNHRADDIEPMLNTNLLFGTYLLEAMQECGQKSLVYTTSSMCHYNDELFHPLNLYAATKQAFSDILSYYTQAKGLKAVTLTLSDTYGTNDERPKILNILKRMRPDDEPVGMTSGEQELDLVYIDDVVRAVTVAMGCVSRLEPSQSLRYRISATKPATLKEIVKVMETVVGYPLPVVWGGRPSPERQILKSMTVIPRLPGWSAQVDLETGLKRMTRM